MVCGWHMLALPLASSDRERGFSTRTTDQYLCKFNEFGSHIIANLWGSVIGKCII